MALAELLQWWNLIFALPFGIALLQTLLQAGGALHLGHFGHGFHLGHHGHGEHDLPTIHSGHTISRDVHSGPGHSSGNPANPEHQPGVSARFINPLLSLLGFGKAPFMVVLSSFCLTWGFVGIICNKVLGYILSPEIFIWISILTALSVAAVSTSLMARGIAKIMPSTESYGTREDNFAGKTGKAITQIDFINGSIATFDNYHNRVELKCRTEGDEILPYGSEVVLLYYDEETRRYVVCRTEDFSHRLKDITDSLKLRE